MGRSGDNFSSNDSKEKKGGGACARLMATILPGQGQERLRRIVLNEHHSSLRQDGEWGAALAGYTCAGIWTR